MEQPKLGQRGDPVIEADFLDYLAVLELEDGDAGEVHLPAGVGGQAAGEEVPNLTVSFSYSSAAAVAAGSKDIWAAL